MEGDNLLSDQSIGNLLIQAVDFANVMGLSVNNSYEPIAAEANEYGKRLDVEVVKCGSHAEKLFLPYFGQSNRDRFIRHVSTDIDMMFVYNNFTIISDNEIDYQRENTDCQYLRLVEAEHPGYYFMMSNDSKCVPTLSEVKEFGFSSQKAKFTLERSIRGSKVAPINPVFLETPTLHGPSVTFNSSMNSGLLVSVDCVFSVKCRTWPKGTEEFFTRQRKFNWPDPSLLEEMKYTGCHLVPTGSRTNDLDTYEWRLSTTTAERILASTLTDRQRLVYQVGKSLIKSQEKTKVIASYYIKTALFWYCEQTAVHEWDSLSNLENIICLLQTLLDYYKNRNVPNYFIKANNLIDHFDDDSIEMATHGIEELIENIVPKLAELLKSVNVMLVQFSKEPIEMLQNTTELLEYLCVNFCFASLVHRFLLQLETKRATGKYREYSKLCEMIYTHLLDSILHSPKRMKLSAESAMETNENIERKSMEVASPLVTVENEIGRILGTVEQILCYFLSKGNPPETIWGLCIEPANIAVTLLLGYLSPGNAGEKIVDDCIHVLCHSAYLHHVYAKSCVQSYWKRYPNYTITSTKTTNPELYHFMEMFVILLIKYKKEEYTQFGVIGRSNADTMRFPMAIRRLLDFMLFYDCDKSWALLQLESALFGGRSIAESIQLKKIEHPSRGMKLQGRINLTKLKLRSKKDKDDEKYRLHAELGNLYHAKGKVQSTSCDQMKCFTQAREHFKESISSCSSDISITVDFASVLIESFHFQEGLSLLASAFETLDKVDPLNSSSSRYDDLTYNILPEEIFRLTESLPVSIPTFLLAVYRVFALYKSVKIVKDQTLSNKICIGLKKALTSQDEQIYKLAEHIIHRFLSN